FHLPIYEDDETQVVLEEHVSTSCQHFKEGLIIHDDLEQIYINQINTVKADKLAHELATNVLKNIEQKDKRSIIKRRMFRSEERRVGNECRSLESAERSEERRQ